MDNIYNKNRPLNLGLIWLIFGIFAACAPTIETPDIAKKCQVELIVLGVGQDAGAPQIGNSADPAWVDPSLRLTATALAIVDHQIGQRFLFEATPHISQQLQRLDTLVGAPTSGLGVDGVFLTHAHIGHYVGLMFFGREAAGSQSIPVFAMPRMASYLSQNGPWSQLVTLGNIVLQPVENLKAVEVTAQLSVTPYRVPHRDEFSETVGYHIGTPSKSVFFVPDIDDWAQWQTDYGHSIEAMATRVDYSFVDATFFDNNELPGRDMSLIPHPRVLETMDRLAHLPAERRKGVHFIHINHTNPIRFVDSEASQTVRERGFSIAKEGQRLCLHSAE